MQEEQLAQLRNYYENEGQEEYRLNPEGVQHLEFLTATRYLARCLPAGCNILDNCAGTGIYAFHLARAGHVVTAGDLLPYNTEIMLQKQQANPLLHSIYCGNADSLPQFASASFDAVLCMGALYHLPDAAARLRTVQEGIRLLKPGGLFVCTYMNRYAVIMNNLQRDLANLPDMLRFAKDGTEGIFYAATAGEMEALLADCGLVLHNHIALDGMAYFLVHTTALLDPAVFDAWTEYHFATCEEPSLLGSSYHNMIIAKKAE